VAGAETEENDGAIGNTDGTCRQQTISSQP
jgi:hypothetical protein